MSIHVYQPNTSVFSLFSDKEFDQELVNLQNIYIKRSFRETVVAFKENKKAY